MVSLPFDAEQRRADVAGRAAVAVAAALLLALTVQIGTGWGASGFVSEFFGVYVYNAIALAASVACWLQRGEHRVAWRFIAIGIAAWAAGDVYYSVAFANVDEVAIPFPSFADLGYLAFYPPVVVGLTLLARWELVRFRRTSSLDVVIAALSAAAVVAAVVLQPVLAATGGQFATVVTNLAYPIFDLVLLGAVTAAVVLAGRRVSARWMLLAGGMAVFAVGDSLYLVRVAEGTYAYGTLLDVAWPLGLVLIAAASVARGASAPAVAAGSFAGVPALFGLIGVALLVYDHFARVTPLALALAAASLVAVVARMTLSLVANERLLRRARIEASLDALTNLGNRRKLQRDLEKLLARRDAEPTVLLMFDLDGFKSYNDTFGHPAGDALLMRLGARLRALDGATAYRLGGDEFCVLAPGSTADVAALRRAALDALHEDGDGFSIRSSCGTVVLPAEAGTPADALRLADRRLYQEKTARPSAAVQTLNALLRALAERDPELETHGADVAELAVAVGRALEMPEEALQRLALASRLHDVGKLAIPDSILAKAGALSDVEWTFMRRHTVIGERIIAGAPALASVGYIIRASHERWDGTGYPDNLRATEIPLEARIIFACDSYEAMITERPYKAAINAEEARAELRRCSGTQFDPTIVDVLMAILERAAPPPPIRLQVAAAGTGVREI